MERYGERLVQAIFVHIQYVLVSVGIGFVLGMVLAIVLSRIPKVSAVALPIISIFQTIPGMVFIGVLFIYLGMKPITIIVALSIWAMFPILKNTYAGILNVDPSLKEAARGCGMRDMQILFKVELPVAMDAIFSGLRMSTVYTVSWAVLSAMIGLGGLGEFVYRGIASNLNYLILGGAIPTSIMAIAFGYLIDLIQKIVTPRGLKGGK
jgi:osmoprotectant transport system permease protein